MLRESDDLRHFDSFKTDLWLRMFAERHLRIVDTETGETVWERASAIAPAPGSKS